MTYVHTVMRKGEVDSELWLTLEENSAGGAKDWMRQHFADGYRLKLAEAVDLPQLERLF